MDNTARGVTILLVEDNEIDVEVTKRALAKVGVSVVLQVARDGSDALDALLSSEGSERPRLVLLDLGLPGIHGLEVLRRIKSNADLCSIPVAVLTGQGGSRAMMESTASGGNMFFVKPITPADAGRALQAVERYWVLMEQLVAKRRPEQQGG
jgi:CheY-like chemotaxis protein